MVGPWSSGAQRELTGAASRSLTVKLADPSEASFTLFGSDPAAVAVRELVDDLWVYRDGVSLFRGRVMDSSDDVATTVHTCSFNVADYRGVLARRMIPPTVVGNAPTYNALSTKAQETIVWDDLITMTQNRAGGNLGIAKADDWPTTGITRAGIVFADGDSVWEWIRTLSLMSDGFDFDIDVNLRAHLYYPKRGTTQGSVLDYGGTVRAVQRQVNSASYANSLRVNGGQSDTTGPFTVTDQVASLSDAFLHPEGLWEATSSEPSVYELAALQALAAVQLADKSTVQPTYKFTMAPGAWRGPSHIWIGDTVTYAVKTGRLNIFNETARVQEISISLDQNNTETVVVTVGSPIYSLTRVVRELTRRLTVLSRR